MSYPSIPSALWCANERWLDHPADGLAKGGDTSRRNSVLPTQDGSSRLDGEVECPVSSPFEPP
jgi:hypothetical protein